MSQRLINALFLTLTYDERKYLRDSDFRRTLNRAPSHFNRYIQKLFRVGCFGSIDYIRSIEHYTTNLHFHTLIIFDRQIICKRDKFLDDNVFRAINNSWDFGFTHIRVPFGAGGGALNYATKYLSKTTSINRLWTKLLSNGSCNVPKSNNESRVVQSNSDVWGYVIRKWDESLTQCDFKYSKFKLVVWSRGFVERYRWLNYGIEKTDSPEVQKFKLQSVS